MQIRVFPGMADWGTCAEARSSEFEPWQQCISRLVLLIKRSNAALWKYIYNYWQRWKQFLEVFTLSLNVRSIARRVEAIGLPKEFTHLTHLLISSRRNSKPEPNTRFLLISWFAMTVAHVAIFITK